jgi:hypothetical protein
MTSEEIAIAKTVFGDAIPWDRVRFDEHSLMAWIGRTHTTGFIINSTSNVSDDVMIHELTHVWQYVNDGLVYIPEAVDAMNSDEGYDYGGVDNLRTKKAAGQGLRTFNREQQGAIVADYFSLIQSARTIEASGQYASSVLREKLDVYIYFVKEVSTLTTAQLDTPNPPIVLPPGLNAATSGNVVVRSTSTPPVTPPKTNPVVLNNRVAAGAAFADLAQPAGKPMEASLVTAAPISTKAIDLAFEQVDSKKLSSKKPARTL